MPGALLETTHDLQPLLLGGVPVVRNWAQIQTELFMVLSEDHVALFAEPSIDAAGGAIDWYASAPGASVPLAELPPPVRGAVEARLAELVREISAHATSLQKSTSETQRQVGNNLALALEIPDEGHIFAVGGAPVIAGWGHVPPGPAVPRQLLLRFARHIEEEEARPPVAPARPEVVAPKPEPRDTFEFRTAAAADAPAPQAAAPAPPVETPPPEAPRAEAIVPPPQESPPPAQEEARPPVGAGLKPAPADTSEPSQTEHQAPPPQQQAAPPPQPETPPPETPDIKKRQLDELLELEEELRRLQASAAPPIAASAPPPPTPELEPLAPAPAPITAVDAPASITAVDAPASMTTADASLSAVAEALSIRTPAADPVEFGLSHPWGVARGVSFLLEAWMFRPYERREAERRATAAPEEARAGDAVMVTPGSPVTVRLEVAACEVAPKLQTLSWTGSLAHVAFTVTPTGEGAGGRLTGAVTFHADGIRIAQLPVLLSLGNSPLEQKRFLTGAGVRRAFASYAGRDRARVLARVQGMAKLGVDVTVDVRSPEAAGDYPAHLLAQIDSADVLYLFWSRHALASAWVAREWQHGLARRGRDFIDPVPLADPRKVAPPPELAGDAQLDAWTLAYLDYEKSLSPWRRFVLRIAGV